MSARVRNFDPFNTRRVRALRRGIELRLLAWCDGVCTALLRPPVGDIEVFHGTFDEVSAWIDARIPPLPRGSASRAARNAAAARVRAEMEAAR
jgi:hypothetical protein